MFYIAADMQFNNNADLFVQYNLFLEQGQRERNENSNDYLIENTINLKYISFCQT